MKEATFNKLMKKLKTQYMLFFMLPFFIVLFGEFSGKDIAIYSGHTMGVGYYLQTFTILFTMIVIPFSLKSFHWILSNKIEKDNQPKAVKSYIFWSGIRLILLQLATLISLIVYYITDSSIGGLCALITIIATLFCVPSKNRALRELTTTNDKLESTEN